MNNREDFDEPNGPLGWPAGQTMSDDAITAYAQDALAGKSLSDCNRPVTLSLAQAAAILHEPWQQTLAERRQAAGLRCRDLPR